MGIDEVGIDKVGIDKVGIDEVGITCGVGLPHHGLPQGTTNTHTNTQWCGPSSPWSASRYHQHTH